MNVRVLERVITGRILPDDVIRENFYSWLKEVREKDIPRGAFNMLHKEVEIEDIKLVKTEKYSYYLVVFKNRQLAAIFNAYDGTFEEIQRSAISMNLEVIL